MTSLYNTYHSRRGPSKHRTLKQWSSTEQLAEPRSQKSTLFSPHKLIKPIYVKMSEKDSLPFPHLWQPQQIGQSLDQLPRPALTLTPFTFNTSAGRKQSENLGGTFLFFLRNRPEIVYSSTPNNEPRYNEVAAITSNIWILTFKALLYLNVAVHVQVWRLFCVVYIPF